MKFFFPIGALVLGAGMLLTACSSDKTPKTESAQAAPPPAKTVAAVVAPAAQPVAAEKPAAAEAPAAPTGFDPSTAPVVTPTLGAFPYFSLIEGYEKGSGASGGNMVGSSAKEYLRDAAFDRYEFFDGAKLIPVEGRLMTTKAIGKGASFFQAQKTYEKLIKDMGGVTVFEGKGEQMKNLKLTFDDKRHRAYYIDYDKMGVYMVRTPDREIWVEVYKTWNDADNDSYWLTVVDKKALPMQATVLPAAEMKKALDATGHVALYLNFDTDQATLKPDAQATIAQIISLLAQNPTLKLAVQGHTDNAGTPQHNQQLSEARAKTVVATLTAQGIPADRLQAAGFGQTKPLTDNASEEGKAKNRRVELVKL